MNIDETYMSRALQLAKNGFGRVSPNPMVGAVVVADGRIIGEGFHRQWGHAHAEVNAIASVAEADRRLLRQSTIYVTLEPCSHYGKTPPCSKLIIDTGIPRVVVGCLDPFKEVSGRGIKMLREAGVDVTTGVLERQCQWINRKFMTAHTHHRPYVTLKWAESADRFVDSDGSQEKAVISSPTTMTLMHRERTGYDAIMVGANTVRRDNPSLLPRLWTAARGDEPQQQLRPRRPTDFQRRQPHPPLLFKRTHTAKRRRGRGRGVSAGVDCRHTRRPLPPRCHVAAR